ncbi:MAG: beta-ketoacyl synthase N-terminal-like domain-containing protein, partial [Ginsengibacter sp.]
MSSNVYVAGLGMITSIGNNVAENLSALEKGHAGIGVISYLETTHRNKIPLAEVKFSNEQLASLSGFSPKISRTALLSLIAAKEAMDNAAIKNFSSLRTGFISANTVGGMDKSEKFFAEFLSDSQKGKLRNVVHHEC